MHKISHTAEPNHSRAKPQPSQIWCSVVGALDKRQRFRQICSDLCKFKAKFGQNWSEFGQILLNLPKSKSCILKNIRSLTTMLWCDWHCKHARDITSQSNPKKDTTSNMKLEFRQNQQFCDGEFNLRICYHIQTKDRPMYQPTDILTFW